MSQPRRRFLQQLALAGAVIALGRAHAAPAAHKRAAVADYEVFAAMVGHDFDVTCESSSGVIKLTEVVRPANLRVHPDPSRAHNECFTLIFEGDPNPPRLPDGIYRIGAGGMAPFEAFMSPVGRSGSGYQIVFNRI